MQSNSSSSWLQCFCKVRICVVFRWIQKPSRRRHIWAHDCNLCVKTKVQDSNKEDTWSITEYQWMLFYNKICETFVSPIPSKELILTNPVGAVSRQCCMDPIWPHVYHQNKCNQIMFLSDPIFVCRRWISFPFSKGFRKCDRRHILAPNNHFSGKWKSQNRSRRTPEASLSAQDY